MVAGLEIMRNKPCIQRQKMFYWEKKGKSVAEIDYLEIHNMKITPIEIKSGTQGGMKSLWLFMREKNSQMPSVVLLRILEHSITLTIKTIMLQGMLQYCRYMPCLYLETIFEYCKVIFIR